MSEGRRRLGREVLRIPDLGAIAGTYAGLPRVPRIAVLALLLALPLGLGLIGLAVALIP